jgi:hypothetical protein
MYNCYSFLCLVLFSKGGGKGRGGDAGLITNRVLKE